MNRPQPRDYYSLAEYQAALRAYEAEQSKIGQPGFDGEPPHSINNPEWVRDCSPKGAPDL